MPEPRIQLSEKVPAEIRVDIHLKVRRAMTELERQAQKDGPSPYADCDDPHDALLDGRFNLEDLVLAITGIHP